MSATELICELPGPDDGSRWLRCVGERAVPVSAPSGDERDTGQDINATAGTPRRLRFLPGEWLYSTSVPVPRRNRGKALRATPYRLEDQLTGALETQHFAFGEVREDGQAGVCVIERRRMDELVADDTPLYPEFALLPAPTAEHMHALLNGDRVVLRHARDSGFSCARSELNGFLLAVLGKQESWPGLVIHHPFDEVSGDEVDIPGLAVEFTSTLPTPDPGGTIALRQGGYAADDAGRDRRQAWKRIAWASLLLALVLLVPPAHRAYELGAREEALRARIDQVYQEIFPAAPATASPMSRVRSRLRELDAGSAVASDFVPRLNPLAEVLGAEARVEFRRLTYRGDGMELDLETPDLGSVERIKQRLAEGSGMAVEILSMSTNNSAVGARLRMSPGAGARP